MQRHGATGDEMGSVSKGGGTDVNLAANVYVARNELRTSSPRLVVQQCSQRKREAYRVYRVQGADGRAVTAKAPIQS
jgi:hypothetical protein